MTQFLPANLLTLFAARDPIPYLPPVAPLSHEKYTTGYSGVGQYLKYFENPKDTPLPTKYETKEERLDRKRREKQEQVAYKLEQEIANWNPNNMEKCSSDPFRTLFVGRVNFDTSESKLKREFDTYGPVKKIYLIHNKKTGSPRGYAFVEYESERDMHAAFKHADGKKIDGKRVLVDVERGRSVKGWLPRRLGGGLGGTRRGGPDMNVKISGREDADRDRFRDSDIGRDRGDDRRERDRSRGRSEKVDRRERDRSRGRDKDRRDRDRDKSRDKDKVDRRGRDRSKDKDKHDRRDREKSREKDKDKVDKKDRDRDRDRKRRHRSRSRDKNDRKRDKKDKERDRADRLEHKIKVEDVQVKEEPVDDYPHYESYGPYEDDYDTYVKQERDDDYENNGEYEA